MAGILKDQVLASLLGSNTARYVSLHAIRHVRQRLGMLKEEGRGKCLLVPPEERNEVEIVEPEEPRFSVRDWLAGE